MRFLEIEGDKLSDFMKEAGDIFGNLPVYFQKTMRGETSLDEVTYFLFTYEKYASGMSYEEFTGRLRQLPIRFYYDRVASIQRTLYPIEVIEGSLFLE